MHLKTMPKLVIDLWKIKGSKHVPMYLKMFFNVLKVD